MKLLVPRQTAQCAGCGLLIVERRRKPCPECGDLRRAINRTADETVGAADRP